MDREGRDPARRPSPPTGGDAPPAELLAAVERASRHLGVDGRGGRPRPVHRFAAPAPGRRRVWVLGALLALSVALGAVASWLRPVVQSPAEVEADLRWAVDNVVRQVEAHHSRTGMLPPREILLPLLGEHLTYDILDGSWVVSAERDGVRVRVEGAPPVGERPTAPAASRSPRPPESPQTPELPEGGGAR